MRKKEKTEAVFRSFCGGGDIWLTMRTLAQVGHKQYFTSRRGPVGRPGGCLLGFCSVVAVVGDN